MKEYIFLNETPADTQKKIKTWLSTGYKIEFINQQTIYQEDNGVFRTFTSLYRSK